MHKFFSSECKANSTYLPVRGLTFAKWRWQRCQKRLMSGLLMLLLLISHNSIANGRTLYRYVNEDGVKVLTYSIPPQYVSKGYEIVDANGQLIEVVPPELSPEDRAAAEAARAEEERLQIWDQQLLKRYSRVSDIEAAKERKLAEISTNINILKSNMANMNNELDKLQSTAADMERAGKPVPDAILDNIKAITEELAAIADKIQLRQEEYQMQLDKFNDDVERFLIIKPEASHDADQQNPQSLPEQVPSK